MPCYAVLQAVLLAITALILFQVQEFVALPVLLSDPEPLASPPAARAARQVYPEDDPTTDNVFMDLWRKPTRSQSLGGAGFRVFPKKNRLDFHPIDPEVTPKTEKPITERRVHLKHDDAAGAAAARGAAAAGGAATPAAGAAEGGKEGITKIFISLLVDLEYDPWGVTYGNQFLDPRFADQNLPRPSLALNPVKNYYPEMVNLTTVCLNRTTIYNEIKVETWLMRSLSSKKKSERPFFAALRRELFDKGESESCHNANYTDWLKYQECALRRNQRMEYFIPRYPRLQLVMN